MNTKGITLSILAGAALEDVRGQTWEEAITEEVFEPLGMTSCGFGPPATPDEIDHPWGHVGDAPVNPAELGADNPPSLGPAGTVHCNLEDWSMFIRDQMRGAQGHDGLVSVETYDRIHTPWGDDGTYALGWLLEQRDWAQGNVLVHDGTNTMFFSVAWVAPEIDRAFMAVTNRGDGPAPVGTDAAIAAMINGYPPSP